MEVAVGPRAALEYRRRTPEHTALYRCVNAHLETFLARFDERPLPSFVEKELRGFLTCGILERGTTVPY